MPYSDPLDTRSKIVTREEALARTRQKHANWVAGHFDPLLAAHAGYLEKASVEGTLVVVVSDGESTLLPLRARAELLAGLRCVELVVIDEGSTPVSTAEASIQERLMQRVHQRNLQGNS